MMEAAAQNKVKLMVAYRLHFERGNLSAIETVRNGDIGMPRIFNSVFCQQVTPGNARLQDEMGGGPLSDLGIYCINAARYLFGAEPYEVFAFSAERKDDRFTEIEEVTTAVMRFPEDCLASFTCSFGAADRSEYQIVGTKGSLRMNPGYENEEKETDAKLTELAEQINASANSEGAEDEETEGKGEQEETRTSMRKGKSRSANA